VSFEGRTSARLPRLTRPQQRGLWMRSLEATMTGRGHPWRKLAAGAFVASIALLYTGIAAAAPLLPTGRPVAPAGRVTALQSFPTGVAVSPDAANVLAIAGPAIQGGVPAGSNGGVALKLVDARTGEVRQTLTVDDAFQGVVYDRTGSHVYVAGGAGNTIHVFAVAGDGTLSQLDDLPASAFVSDIALSRDGRGLWAAEPTAPGVELIDLTGHAKRRKVAAPSPDRLALSRDGRTLFASDWRGNCVTAIPTRGGPPRCVRVGRHPTGVATALHTMLAADSNDATLGIYRPGDRRARLMSLAQVGRRTDAPNAVALAPDGNTAYVSLGADDAVAVLRRVAQRRGRRVMKPVWRLAGLIPTGWYPTALALGPHGRKLHVVTARGLGHSVAATQPYTDPDPAATVPDGAYGTAGTLETIPVPDRSKLARYTADVRRYLRARTPSGAARNPIVAGRAGPIKHVIYITRENKTYDADLGDLHPGPGTSLAVFGQPVTPNLHALERGFVEAQSFYYQGFASTVGHMWEDAGAVSDYYEHTQAAATGAHTTHISDSWSDRENYPLTGTVSEQAWRAGLSVRTYNQETVQQAKLLPEELQADQSVFPDYDLHVPDTKREAGWEREFRQFESHACAGELAKAYGKRCSLPDFEYVYFGEDHTTVVDEPGYPTIEAQVADNDYATGKLIDAVSHSPDWRSTLVIVLDDDPQGTGDHISAYRGFVAVASPWVKRGLITQTHYDLTSALGAIDRILGLPPITDYAATTRPLDEFFTDRATMTPFTADGSGVAANPFVPLPGPRARSDPKHGIYSFTEPDATDPRIAAAATWRQLKGTEPPRLSVP
jgi:DNA-binding beta-propeller fold protein YncE